MNDLIEELRWRGLLVQSTDVEALGDHFAAGPVTFYCGFDPTAASLHVGHLVQVLTMRRLQLAGHKPIAVVGGATGLIGDPRMSGERVLNDEAVVAGWVESLRAQISAFLDFDGDNPATIVSNLDWTAPISALEFLRDIGKHFRVGKMISKDTVARRLESEQGISYTEFSYQILQSLDFHQLYERHGCTVQQGGNDQWGNLTAGVEYIRKATGTSVHCFTTPLITKADGTKFGKSEGGAVWLDPNMTSPYAFYQFWLNTDDRDVVGYLKVFTFLSRDQIEELAQAVEDRPGRRDAQRTLARELTRMVHGESAVDAVIAASEALFGNGDLMTLDAQVMAQIADEVPTVGVDGVGLGVVDLAVAAGLVAGKNAARRAIAEGGVYVNNRKIIDPDEVISTQELIAGRWLVLRRGRKTMALAELRS